MSAAKSFYLRYNVVSSSRISTRFVISRRFLFFSNKSFTALKPQSTKYQYDDGKGNSDFLEKKVLNLGISLLYRRKAMPLFLFMLN
jgi:hypothetical protein